MSSQWVDLREILRAWPYDAENDSRLVRGDDGREVLQVRTPLGIEQLELDGRPDGARPHGVESAFEFQRARLEKLRKLGKESEFDLSPADCRELFNEGTLFYFRYVRLFQLKDWARTIRDTERNSQVFDFVHRYARREDDQLFLEKWRPYIIRIQASARVMQALEQRAYDRALELAAEAVRKIEALDDLDDETFKFERERSVAALRDLAAQIQKDRPMSELEQLEHQLRRAIERQEFEKAAQLRDRIRALKKQQIC